MDNPFQYFVPSKSLNSFDKNETEPKSQKRAIEVVEIDSDSDEENYKRKKY